jgi:hypothetical protein
LQFIISVGFALGSTFVNRQKMHAIKIKSVGFSGKMDDQLNVQAK